MANRLDIVNGALRFLGKAPIQSLNSDSEIAKSIDYAIDSAVSILLLKCDWAFSIKIKKLSTPLTESCSSEFKYTFMLPYDFGRIHRFYCGCEMGYPCCFEIINRYILSNSCPIQFYYIQNKIDDFEFVPDYFIRLISYFIAQDISLAYTKNLNEQQYLLTRYERELSIAINLNNANRPFIKGNLQFNGESSGCC